MASLKDIRNKIDSVGNIKKITSTMEMVASARLHKAQAKAKASEPYARKLKEILEKVGSAATDIRHPFFEIRKIKKIGLIVIAADKGLCGSYNTNIFSACDKFLREHSKSAGIELITLGKKAVEYYNRREWPVRHKQMDWSGKITRQQVKEFTDMAVKCFTSHAVDSLYIAYTKYENLFSRHVVIEEFLPIRKPTHETQSHSLDYIFEPNIEEIYETLLPHYCITKIQTILHHAYASELSARVVSMKTASKNAEEMIGSLILERNKLRQADITNEMLEIIAGT